MATLSRSTIRVPHAPEALRDQAHRAIHRLITPEDHGTTSAIFFGREFEYFGEDDPLAEDADRATADLEGLRLHESLPGGGPLGAITTAWIERQVDAAILQSAPERAATEWAKAGGAGVHRPPSPRATIRVPALSLQPLIDAIDTDARRFAFDPQQREFRARALLRLGPDRRSEPALSRTVAGELAEELLLERLGSSDDEAVRRRAVLARAHTRRVRYTQAFAVAVRRLQRSGHGVAAAKLFQAFDAIAGLDKAPFRRGPSENLTVPLLASMAVEFYRVLTDPLHTASFLLLTFPIKNSSGLRTNVATEAADLGELLMLAQFRRMLQFLDALGLPRVRIVCLTDGIVYSRYLGPYERARAVFYRENIRQFRDLLGLNGRVLIVDAENLLRRVPHFDESLHTMRRALDRAELESELVRAKMQSLIRSFLFHVHEQHGDLGLLARIVNASLEGRDLPGPSDRAEQRRIWAKAGADARWYAAHLLVMKALDIVDGLVAAPFVRATVHPKPGQFAPAPVNVRDFGDLPYHRKPLLDAGRDPLNLDTYLGVNLWADPTLCYVDVYVGANRSPFFGVRLGGVDNS